MDMMTVTAPVTTTPAQTAQGTSQSAGKPAEASFADLLMGLSAQSAGNVQTGQGATWRELQGMSTTTQSSTLSGEMQDLLTRLQEMSGGDEDTKLQELLKLLEQMQKKMQLQVSEQGNEMVGQTMALLTMLASNLMTDGTAGTDLQTALQTLQTDFTALQTQNTAMQDLLTMLSATQQPAGEATNAFWEMMAAQTGLANGTAAMSTAEAQGAFAPQAAATEVAMGVPAEKSAELAEVPVLEVQHEKPAAQPETQFDASIRAAKELLGKDDANPAEPAKAETDIDALQRQVDSGAYLRNTALANTTQVEAQEETAEAPAVRTQVEEGILNGIRAGQEQFSIKLKPEGLGELTIKIAKNAEGIMSLSIIAKNAETAKSLAGELDLLRQNLEPMKVEVDSILTERQYEMNSQQQSFEQQRQSGQWQQMRGAAYYGDEPLQAAEAGAAQSSIAAGIMLENSMLDAYI